MSLKIYFPNRILASEGSTVIQHIADRIQKLLLRRKIKSMDL